MVSLKRQENVSRNDCYQMLEAVGCVWKKQVELFHSQLAQLDGPDRAIKLAELVVIEHERLFDQGTC